MWLEKISQDAFEKGTELIDYLAGDAVENIPTKNCFLKFWKKKSEKPERNRTEFSLYFN